MTSKSPSLPQRRSIRLEGFDYRGSGAYYLTICTHDHRCLFGDVRNWEMRLNALGEIVREEWFRAPDVRPYVELYEDEFVVMPNHVHGIVWIIGSDWDESTELRATQPISAMRATHRVAPTGPKSASVGAIVGQFKSKATKRINEVRRSRRPPVWQRNYFEHVIRSEKSLPAIRSYILGNPANWHEDRLNPVNWKQP